ncbi:methylglutaconyl-CoA hydratase [Cognatiyoonia koreensis]|uniref:Methylglutaconyl-CoA hydratase n=1 Tax=Cognatiyoonia koreensis TaxID=364200 RepID=A0A1I0NJM2_9RHOB|nr:crotonase/enoyl-CoA hydratase family protein [Cognatiyoonia koreensis]SEW01702.1 methylglutaconyl-CoA hydratase [Cognatiyoonia koreensis]
MALIRTETDARGVCTLTLARAQKHNAMSAQMIDDIADAAQTLSTDDKVRVVVLAADGPTFCAGGDLGWMRDQMDASDADRRAGAMRLARMLQALNTLPKPLIGRVHANAFGGGVGLMSVCDTVITVPEAKFGLTETKLGLIPATIGPYVVARIGETNARRVFMNSRLFTAQDAKDFGLVAHVVATDELDKAIAEEVAPYLACAPGAVAAAKALTRSLGTPIDDTVIAASADALVAAWEGGEAREGIAAFFDKRKPRWAE